ncbi:hypothetical protein MM440_11050 [Arsenicicoccus piscis]|uniref:SAF domain-containing protein n=1 Tax=Arsenicicoccus piscis TaxID=673954 RepID=A0ABQ6HKG5_9MICO|nr:hypothetical protein [Arsenicicoccus piscis]MCH8628297.1 hypothetical protein [Arsenicicoccus piscis]GMA18558.1 hypothetical protein GCM10025862_05790 [Arsenicicoccus piscis]
MSASTLAGPRSSRPARDTGRGGSAAGGTRARRLQPPSWRDARLLGGVALVLASTVAGAKVVANAADTTSYLVMTTAVAAGEPLTASDVRQVDARLGDRADSYLPATTDLTQPHFATRDLVPGELVPVAAAGDQRVAERRQLALPVTSGALPALVKGTQVEVWVSDRTSAAGVDRYGAPHKVVERGTVARDPDRSGVLGGAASTTLSVFVPVDAVPALLTAVDSGAKVSLVPLPGTVVGDGS